jgi:hypothetical protein
VVAKGVEQGRARLDGGGALLTVDVERDLDRARKLGLGARLRESIGGGDRHQEVGDGGSRAGQADSSEKLATAEVYVPAVVGGVTLVCHAIFLV